MKTRKLVVALGVMLLLAQVASAGYAVCIRLAFAGIGAGVYAITSCNPIWRCWCVPVDEENPLLGCSTNFPSQVLYRVGRGNGWFAARNLTYKTQAKAIAAGCTTNNLGPADVAIEEWLSVEESSTPDGPWTFQRMVFQSPDDLDLMVTNIWPQCFYRVVSTNATPDVLMRPQITTNTTAFWRASTR